MVFLATNEGLASALVSDLLHPLSAPTMSRRETMALVVAVNPPSG